MSETLIVGPVATPAGVYEAAITPDGLARLAFPTDRPDECTAWARRWAPKAQILTSGRALDELATQLTAYFERRLHDFSIPLDLRGTPLQLRVWRAVLAIGYGEVRSYADVAAAIGQPRAFRAVGAANGANPIPILVPCHRLVGSNGALIKYGGGLDTKRRLLVLEGASVPG